MKTSSNNAEGMLGRLALALLVGLLTTFAVAFTLADHETEWRITPSVYSAAVIVALAFSTGVAFVLSRHIIRTSQLLGSLFSRSLGTGWAVAVKTTSMLITAGLVVVLGILLVVLGIVLGNVWAAAGSGGGLVLLVLALYLYNEAAERRHRELLDAMNKRE
jgi:hypothetical protein